MKNSPAGICGLRHGDRIIEVNGRNVQKESYASVLSQIKDHTKQGDLELLVLDKKAMRWYEERNCPISIRTLPAIVRIRPIINIVNEEAINAARSTENIYKSSNFI